MTKLKMIREAAAADRAGAKIEQLKEIREVIDPSLSLSDVMEMLDLEITKDDYNTWMSHILDICKERGVRPTSRRQFEDVAFELLDNDPKLDMFVGGDTEKLKRQIVGTLWNAYQASVGHGRIEKVAKTVVKKAREEEEASTLRASLDDPDDVEINDQEDEELVPGIDVQDVDVEEIDYTDDDINVMTQKYPEEDLGGWDVPLRSKEEEESCEDEEWTLKSATAIKKAAGEAAVRDAGKTRKTKNPYTHGTLRHGVWKDAYRAAVKQHKDSTKAMEEEERANNVKVHQDHGYRNAREYYSKVLAAARSRVSPPVPPRNPHTKGSPEAAAWEDGFDMFMRDVESAGLD